MVSVFPSVGETDVACCKKGRCATATGETERTAGVRQSEIHGTGQGFSQVGVTTAQALGFGVAPGPI